VKIAKRVDSDGGSFGRSSGGQKYEWVNKEGDHGFWASEKFNKGVKSMREGAVDAYDTVMFRMRYNAEIDRWCLVQYHGRWYQIQSFNEDYQTNEIQITAIEMANQNVTIVINNSNS
jgi:SPP1 family predicted phage head-tail adaptor